MKVIVPSKGSENLSRCLGSLCKHHRDPSIIVVDDGVDWREVPFSVQIVPGMQPFCWARNINIGLRAAGDEDVVIVGDDVEFVEPVIETLDRLSEGRHIITPMVDGLVGCDAQKWVPGQTGVTSTERLCYVCVLIPASARRRIGEFDESLVGYGFEDDDYNLRARVAGVELLVAQEVRVEHDHAKQPSEWRKRPDIWARYEENARIYREKWGL